LLFKAFFGLLEAAERRRLRITALLVLGVVSSGVAVLPPLAFGNVITVSVNMLDSRNSGASEALRPVLGWSAAGGPLLLWAVLTVLADILRVTYGYQVTRFFNRLVVDVRAALCLGVLDGTDRGNSDRTDVAYLINADCQQLNALYAVPMTTVFSDLLDTVIMTLVIGVISWKLALILVVPAAPIYVIARRAGRAQNRYAVQTRAAETRLNAHADHLSSDWLTIRIFAGRDTETAWTRGLLARVTGLNARSNTNLAGMMGTISAIRLVAAVAVIAYAVTMVSRGQIAVGSVATLMLYLGRYYSPAINLSKSYQAMQRGAVSADRIAARLRLRTPAATRAGTAARPVLDERTNVTLAGDELEFLIPDKGPAQLPDFEIDSTGLLLLTGPSGSGKSTILRSLIGVGSRPASGRFTVDGRDLDTVEPEDRLTLFSYAGQENALLPGTVLDTVTYPGTSAAHSGRQALDALARVGLASLGQRAVGLNETAVSGGEARRVVLARALAAESSFSPSTTPARICEPIQQDSWT
jgi:ABC-type multidrug transport system fused ATPase/permease subunit